MLLAIVLLGFAGYELAWKARRLAADRAKLDRTVADLAELGARLQAVAYRAAALGPAVTSLPPAADRAAAQPPVGGSVPPAAEPE